MAFHQPLALLEAEFCQQFIGQQESCGIADPLNLEFHSFLPNYRGTIYIDGASAAQRLRYITLPLLNPQIIMVCILELIFNFKIFDQVYATTQGGPASASQTIIMLLYDTAFKFFRFGDASVMAVFVFITLMAITLLQWRIFRKPVEY